MSDAAEDLDCHLTMQTHVVLTTPAGVRLVCRVTSYAETSRGVAHIELDTADVPEPANDLKGTTSKTRRLHRDLTKGIARALGAGLTREVVLTTVYAVLAAAGHGDADG